MRRALLWVMALVAGLSAPPLAGAAFEPTIEGSLSTRQVGANPRFDFRFVQRAGEEATAELTFLLPRGMRLPRDARVTAGEKLGQGVLKTAIAPFCTAAAQVTFDATLFERDRTPEEIRQGLRAVWVADLGPVNVEFPWMRTASGRLRAVTEIPSNPLACPPLSLNSTVNRTSAESGTMILQNPRKPGRRFARFTAESTEGSRHVVNQRIRFRK